MKQSKYLTIIISFPDQIHTRNSNTLLKKFTHLCLYKSNAQTWKTHKKLSLEYKNGFETIVHLTTVEAEKTIYIFKNATCWKTDEKTELIRAAFVTRVSWNGSRTRYYLFSRFIGFGRIRVCPGRKYRSQRRPKRVHLPLIRIDNNEMS